MVWVCDNCYNTMNVLEEEHNRYRVECPVCGTQWYVDGDDEKINDELTGVSNDEADEKLENIL